MSVARHVRNFERACDALISIGPVASGALLLATAGYLAWCVTNGFAILNLDLVMYVVPPLSTIATFVFFRRALTHAGSHARPYAALFAAIGLTLWSSRTWFAGPMHDIAMVFGSHGRFGCTMSNADGSPLYFVRDDTLPWLLFGPSLLGVVGRWLIERRRGWKDSLTARRHSPTGRTTRGDTP